MTTAHDLAKQLANQYGISEQSSLDAVETYLDQINRIDHTDIDEDAIDDDTADVIRGSFDAYYDDPGGADGRIDEMLCDIIDLAKRIQALRTQAEDLTEERNRIILDAWKRGATAKDLASSAGISLTRLYKIVEKEH